jgi:dCMP deaminase
MTRPSLVSLLMNFAVSLAERATCSRLRVGCIITDVTLREVLAYGYNGNARGFPNACDSNQPGACGCLHAEINALIKVRARVNGMVVFTSVAPCVSCAKAMINAGVDTIHFQQPYRSFTGLDALIRAGIPCIQVLPFDQRLVWRRSTLDAAIEGATGL